MGVGWGGPLKLETNNISFKKNTSTEQIGRQKKHQLGFISAKIPTSPNKGVNWRYSHLRKPGKENSAWNISFVQSQINR